jgi:hypothetical protein
MRQSTQQVVLLRTVECKSICLLLGNSRNGDNQGKMEEHCDERAPEEQLEPSFIG